MARVLAEGLTKKFGAHAAVDNVTFEVEDKGFVCLLGAPGAGKTTILRMIAGLEMPTSGNVYIGEDLVNDVPPGNRGIAMMFQTFALYPHKTVFENLSFPLVKQAMAKDEIRSRVKEVADLLRISHLLDSKPGTLSGGEKQRVALGRVVVRRSKVYLWDEPLTNLDAQLRLHMRAELKKLQSELGQTTIFATPDEREALAMAEKIAVLENGKLHQYDATKIMYDHPTDMYAAGFIGSPPMNFIDCTMREDHGKALLDATHFVIDVSNLVVKMETKPIGTELIAGVRPSEIVVSEERADASSIPAEVYAIEPMGIVSVIDFKVGDHLVKAKVPASFKTAVKDKLWLSINKERLHIFDKKTEKNLL